MAKLRWNRAKKSRPSEQAFPGRPRRGDVLWADSWDDLERIAEGRSPATRPRESYSKSEEAKLLHQVVMALNNRGMANILADLPEVLAYFGGKLPTVGQVLGARPDNAIITGGITFDDKVWSFTCARIVRAKKASQPLGQDTE